VVASCRNTYYGTNFISAVPTSLLIAPGLRTIQFLFYPEDGCGSKSTNTDLAGFHSYIFASMLASSGEEQILTM
jgi:hypothetical protein